MYYVLDMSHYTAGAQHLVSNPGDWCHTPLAAFLEEDQLVENEESSIGTGSNVQWTRD